MRGAVLGVCVAWFALLAIPCDAAPGVSLALSADQRCDYGDSCPFFLGLGGVVPVNSISWLSNPRVQYDIEGEVIRYDVTDYETDFEFGLGGYWQITGDFLGAPSMKIMTGHFSHSSGWGTIVGNFALSGDLVADWVDPGVLSYFHLPAFASGAGHLTGSEHAVFPEFVEKSFSIGVSTSGVPEPCTLTLFAPALLVVLLTRQRRSEH